MVDVSGCEDIEGEPGSTSWGRGHEGSGGAFRGCVKASGKPVGGGT